MSTPIVLPANATDAEINAYIRARIESEWQANARQVNRRNVWRNAKKWLRRNAKRIKILAFAVVTLLSSGVLIGMQLRTEPEHIQRPTKPVIKASPAVPAPAASAASQEQETHDVRITESKAQPDLADGLQLKMVPMLQAPTLSTGSATHQEFNHVHRP